MNRGWILKEGYPFVAPPLLLSATAFLLGWTCAGWLLLLVGAAVAMFFRNPSRRPLRMAGVALAPADGRVVEIAREHGEGALMTRVSIFMSIFNVHVNRCPLTGEVVDVRHEPGGFRPAHKGGVSKTNERNVLRIRTEDGKVVTCVQVAGVLARRIVCWVGRGSLLLAGEPFGMIRFGSRVECYLPEGFEVEVRVGQRVWGGDTVLGRFRDSECAQDGPGDERGPFPQGSPG